MKTKEPMPHVAFIVIVSGVSDSGVPGFAAAVVGTDQVFTHFGKPKDYGEKRALLEKFSAWKNEVGPKIVEVELSKGSFGLFMECTMDMPASFGNTDLQSYYRGVMNRELAIEDFYECIDGLTLPLAERAVRQAKLYEALFKLRCALPKINDPKQTLGLAGAFASQSMPSAEEDLKAHSI